MTWMLGLLDTQTAYPTSYGTYNSCALLVEPHSAREDFRRVLQILDVPFISPRSFCSDAAHRCRASVYDIIPALPLLAAYTRSI